MDRTVHVSISSTQVNDVRLHNKDKREDRRGFEGYTKRIYHTNISNTSVNDLSLHDEDVGNERSCLKGYTTRVD